MAGVCSRIRLSPGSRRFARSFATTSSWTRVPTGRFSSIASRVACRLSGSCSTLRLSSTASMPQPMSTPTAAGMTAERVGITDPTVAPIPRCTSGMAATCGPTQKSFAPCGGERTLNGPDRGRESYTRFLPQIEIGLVARHGLVRARVQRASASLRRAEREMLGRARRGTNYDRISRHDKGPDRYPDPPVWDENWFSRGCRFRLNGHARPASEAKDGGAQRVADPASKRLVGVRPITASGSASAAESW